MKKIVFTFLPIIAMTFPNKSVMSQRVENKFKSANYYNREFEGYLANKMHINLEKRLMTIDLDTILDPYQNRP